ncbi:MAG: hypothetical protein U5K51_04340 [Flavobacteriaceae bacterium]|nr:hypothetical protein [Flavobacteriaceae bacterium]
MVITQMHPETLKSIAENGDGTYLNGNNTNKTVAFVEDLLIKADKKEFETKQFSDYKDQFQWFVGIALILLILDSFLLDKRTKWIQKLNLFNEKKENEITAFLVLFMPFLVFSQEQKKAKEIVAAPTTVEERRFVRNGNETLMKIKIFCRCRGFILEKVLAAES